MPNHQTQARQEMDHWLQHKGIRQRSLPLIDAMIALFISLNTQKDPHND